MTVSESTPSFSLHFNLSHAVKCSQLLREKKGGKERKRKKHPTNCTKAAREVKIERAVVICFTNLDGLRLQSITGLPRIVLSVYTPLQQMYVYQIRSYQGSVM